MLPDRALGEKLIAFCENLTEGREVKRIDDLGASGDLPGTKKRENSEDSQPVRYEATKTPPPAAGSYRMFFVNGDEI